LSQYYSLEPNDGNYLEPEKVLEVIIRNFKNYLLDEDAGKREAAKRLEFLKEMNAGEELISLYENSNPIRCSIFNEDKSSQLDFDLSNNQGILLLPDCETIRSRGLDSIAHILSEKTGYKLRIEEE
jgi:hypothetical protein